MSIKSTHRYDLTMAAVSQPPIPASARTKETCIYMPLLANCADGIFFFERLIDNGPVALALPSSTTLA